MKKAVILAPKEFGEFPGKVANTIVMYERNYKAVAVIDFTKAGKDAGEVLGVGPKNIPIISTFRESLKYKPETLVIGVAPIGGFLTKEWRDTIKEAISNGLDVVSGLHDFLSDDPELVNLAEKNNVKLIDKRKPPPPETRRILDGSIRDCKVPRVYVTATDAACGKNVTCYELILEMERRGMKPGFVATGQTTLTVGANAGMTIDAAVMDFAPGYIEALCLQVAEMDKDIIFVEGQSSLSHPAYSQDSISCLYGCWPQAIILVHDPFRKVRMEFPSMKVPEPDIEIKMIETIFNFHSPRSKVVAVSVNGYRKTNEEIIKECERIEKECGIPATDPYRFTAKKLLDAILAHLKNFEEL